MKPWSTLVLAGLVVVGVPSSEAYAQVGGWVGASIAYDKPATGAFTQSTIVPFRQELFESTQSYAQKNKPSFDFGGGVRVGRFGAGVAISRYADNEAAGLSLVVPHPVLFNRSARASGTTQDPLTRKETAIHFEGRYIANLPHASVAVFAGPTYLRTSQELVTDVGFRETLNLATLAHAVSLTNVDISTVDLNAWGFNVGADVAYYFSERIGVGSIVRFSHASVGLPNSITGATNELKVGGLNVGGGMRFRF